MKDKKYVITITRQFGSLGRPIAKLMAEQLGIEYYDRDIVDQAAKQLKLPASVVDEEEESAKKIFKNPFPEWYFRLVVARTVPRMIFSMHSRISYDFLQRKAHA